MTDTSTSTAGASAADAGTMSSERLARFQADVGSLKAGGSANPERIGTWVGIAAGVVGAVIAIIAYAQAQSADRQEYIFRYQILAGIGLAVALAGAIIWIRNSLTRYLRWWLIRMVYEQREQTDRLIEAIRER
jgi:lipid-binding SYLF domain-containing protein